MISATNQPTQKETADADFTELHYRELLRLAKRSYSFAAYRAIPWKDRFLLWRHDLDYSINRAHALAKIELEEEVISTYFVNPHSEFYNPFEKSQWTMLKEIQSMGHDIGLHFEASYYDIHTEEALDKRVAQEARWIEEQLGCPPVAFSFHNPTATQLSCEAERYGGLINCYSARLKSKVTYCSDSNGYWRFNRLYDVLFAARAPCLQVLTHPGWWQEKPARPRCRVFRSAYGRAAKALRYYDAAMTEFGRLNHAGNAEQLRFLQIKQPKSFETCDFLWHQKSFQTLFMELKRLYESQVHNLCKFYWLNEQHVTEAEINSYWKKMYAHLDCRKWLKATFDKQTPDLAELDEKESSYRCSAFYELATGQESVSAKDLEEGCVNLCKLMQKLADWGLSQPMGFDGLTNRPASFTSAPEPDAISSAHVNTQAWTAFKEKIIAAAKTDE